MELLVMAMVQFPDRIDAAWEAGEFGALGYLAEAVASWPEPDLERTDPVLFAHITRGLAEVRRRGWSDMLDAALLHGLEDLLGETLDNQRAEGVVLTPEEVSEVRSELAREHLPPKGGWAQDMRKPSS